MARPRTKEHVIVENAYCIDVSSFKSQLSFAREASVTIRFKHRGWDVAQTIDLIRVPRVPFGGHQWFFKCPETRARARRLYRPTHEGLFLSRAAHGLRNRIEHQTAEEADITRYFKLYKRISGAEPPMGTFSVLPPRQKGMHVRTYQTLLMDIKALQDRILHQLDNWLKTSCNLQSSRQYAAILYAK